ncbi:hypothetical protein GCM10009608_31000 [Pseudonocardia alaniniphila]
MRVLRHEERLEPAFFQRPAQNRRSDPLIGDEAQDPVLHAALLAGASMTRLDAREAVGCLAVTLPIYRVRGSAVSPRLGGNAWRRLTSRSGCQGQDWFSSRTVVPDTIGESITSGPARPAED